MPVSVLHFHHDGWQCQFLPVLNVKGSLLRERWLFPEACTGADMWTRQAYGVE